MKAETAYNVIQALPEAEVKRLYSMLNIQQQVKPKKPETKFLSVEQAMDAFLASHHKRIKKIKRETTPAQS